MDVVGYDLRPPVVNSSPPAVGHNGVLMGVEGNVAMRSNGMHDNTAKDKTHEE
jgi:hypothetical protein